MLIDVAFPGNRNLIMQEAEKIVKYRDRIMEISAYVKHESKGDTGNTGVNGTISVSLTQTVPE
jgi:hypothetical protein